MKLKIYSFYILKILLRLKKNNDNQTKNKQKRDFVKGTNMKFFSPSF